MPNDHKPIAVLVKTMGLGESTIRTYMREARDSADPRLQACVKKVYPDAEHKSYRVHISESYVRERAGDYLKEKSVPSEDTNNVTVLKVKFLEKALEERDKRIEKLEQEKNENQQRHDRQLVVKDEQIKDISERMKEAHILAAQRKKGLFRKMFANKEHEAMVLGISN